MSFLFHILFCFVAVALISGTALAQEMLTAGEVEFAAPPGWTVAKRMPSALGLLHKGKEGSVSMMLIGADEMKGPLPEALRRSVFPSFREVDLKLDRLTEGSSIYGYPAVTFDETGRHKTMGRKLRATGIGFDIGGGRLQVGWLLTIANADGVERKRELEQVIRSFRFKNNTASVWDPLRQRKVPAGLAGLYWGTKVRNRVNFSGALELVADRAYVLLLPTGQAYRGVPPGGRVMDMDFAARLKENPLKCGAYSVQGDQIVFEWQGELGLVKRKGSILRKKGGEVSFEFDGMDVSPARPPSITRVDGHYTSTSFTSSSTALSNTSVAGQRFLKLTPDGRYTKSGFVGVSFSHDTGDGRTSGSGRSKSDVEAGSYAIEGFRLTLKPDSGPPEYFTIVIETPGPSPGALFINDVPFLRSKK